MLQSPTFTSSVPLPPPHSGFLQSSFPLTRSFLPPSKIGGLRFLSPEEPATRLQQAAFPAPNRMIAPNFFVNPAHATRVRATAGNEMIPEENGDFTISGINFTAFNKLCCGGLILAID